MVLLTKVLVTIVAVTTLSLIAERVSPRAAGILSGYPLGTAISLYFIGLEQGAVFAGTSAPFTLMGLAAMLTFLFAYYQVSARVTGKAKAIILASLAAFSSFLGIAALLDLLHPPAWSGLGVAAIAILGFGLLFRGIVNTKIQARMRLGPGVLLFRAALASLIILAITGAAHLVPAEWAGLFSAFPSTIFPLLLILHSTYGAEQAHTVIKNLPTGLWALVLYVLTVSIAYPQIGIGWGTLLGFGVATIYQLGLALFNHRTFLVGSSSQQNQ